MGGHLNRDGVCMLARKKEEKKKGGAGVEEENLDTNHHAGA